MAIIYTVKPGDGLARIAWKHGFFADTIWQFGANAALRFRRADREVLRAGDTVAIPDREAKAEPADTDRRHVFRVRGVPARFQVRLLDDGKPRSAEPYRFVIDGKRTIEGVTDAGGWIRCSIMPDAVDGLLTVGDDGEVYRTLFGYLDPIDTPSGVAARLRALGHYDGTGDDMPAPADPAFRQGLAAFQEDHGLPATGTLDDATRARLQAAFGC